MKLTIAISIPLRQIAFQLNRKTNLVKRFLSLLLATLGLTSSFMPITLSRNILAPAVSRYRVFAGAAEQFDVMSLTLNNPRYTITELPPIYSSDKTSWPRGINEKGEVVGYSTVETPADSNQHRATRWKNGIPIDLQLPPPSEAYGINKDGQIVGRALFPDPKKVDTFLDHAFRENRGKVYDLGAFEDNDWGTSKARAINSSGLAVGFALHAGPTEQAALWNPTITTPNLATNLGSKLGTNISLSHATSINKEGQIVGDFLKDGTGLRHAFLLQQEKPEKWTWIDIGALDSSYDSYAEDINDNAQVVGYLQVPLKGSDAFVYDATGMQHLNKLLPDTESKAHAINMFGQIVGSSGGHACLWEERIDPFSPQAHWDPIDLNNEIPVDSGWVLHEAFDINDAEQIIGDGFVNGQQRGFLLTPTTGRLTISKVVRPRDAGRFNLQIDGITVASDIGDGGSNGPRRVPVGHYRVGETAGTGTDLNEFTTLIDCEPGPHHVTGTNTIVPVGPGKFVKCTITNVGPPQLTINKLLVPSDDPGLFNLQIDGSTKAADIGNGGTTGRQVVKRTGYHVIGETAGVNTNLQRYSITISCPGARGNRNGTASLLLSRGDDKICTIVNVAPNATCVDICTALGGQRAACVIKCEQPKEQDCWGDYQDCVDENLHTKLFCFRNYQICRSQIAHPH